MTSTMPDQAAYIPRRIDRVLAPEYLADLQQRPLVDVRALRDEAEQEETALSYLRRLLQGRIDILRAELARRAGAAAEDLITALPRILAEPTRARPRGMGRHLRVESSAGDDTQLLAGLLVDDVDLTDVGARTEAELGAAIDMLQAEERQQSDRRRAVQHVVDACSLEITRRYRDGEAQVADLLAR